VENHKLSNRPSDVRPVDLIILGSGPAGVSAALHLIQIDPAWAGRMVILEKDHHPRHKLCGGAITVFGLNILKRLGISLPIPIPQARVEDMRILLDRHTINVRGEPIFITIHRADLDAYLADRVRELGVEIREDEAAQNIQIDEEGVTVTTNQCVYRTKAVVGADGAKGLTRRMLNRRQKPSQVARTLEIIQPSVENAPLFTEKYAVFDFTPIQTHLQGYFWDFPAWVNGEPSFNRGVYDARMFNDKSRANLPQILEKELLYLGAATENQKPDGHPIHWFSPTNRFSRPRLLAVGDAAGVDPLFGEGIAPALGYGEIAAQAVHAAWQSGDFTFRNYGRRVLFSPVGRYLLLRWWTGWWIYRLCHQAWFVRTFWLVTSILAAILPRPRLKMAEYNTQDKEEIRIEPR
jgi:menaquinone-9 beta-reductase